MSYMKNHLLDTMTAMGKSEIDDEVLAEAQRRLEPDDAMLRLVRGDGYPWGPGITVYRDEPDTPSKWDACQRLESLGLIRRHWVSDDGLAVTYMPTEKMTIADPPIDRIVHPRDVLSCRVIDANGVEWHDVKQANLATGEMVILADDGVSIPCRTVTGAAPLRLVPIQREAPDATP